MLSLDNCKLFVLESAIYRIDTNYSTEDETAEMTLLYAYFHFYDAYLQISNSWQCKEHIE